MALSEKFVYTGCMGTGCHEHCFLKTIVRDGKIIRTEKAPFGSPEGDHYGICQKGISYAKFPYLSERLLHPLKRVGKRGEGKFEKISWDQAMNEIGAKLRNIRDEYGPESVVVNTFVCGYPSNWAALHGLLMTRFIHSFGATATEMETIDSHNAYATQVDFGSSFRYMNFDLTTLPNYKQIVIWGSNPLGATRAVATTRNMMEAQERGAKIICIGLTFDSTAAKADKFIPIKGGTDAALALAMNHIIIEEKLYDLEYITNQTVAPLLVRDDNGKLLRESDIVSGGDPAKYVFWSRSPAAAKAISAGVNNFGDSSPDLLAEQIISGISCRTAFLKLKEHLKEWTPEKQEELTGVPANTARALVKEYIESKPNVIWLNLGMRYYNAREAHRAIELLAVLTGNKLALAVLGKSGWPARLNDGPIMCPDGIEHTKGSRPTVTEFLETFKNDKPKYKALLNVVGNPLHAAPGRQMWQDRVFPKLELTVSYEVRLTETGLFSDYVLPDTTTFERMELINTNNWMVLQEPAIDPMGEARSPAEFWNDLAKQVGLENYFGKTTEEWLNIRLETDDPAIAGVSPPLTLAQLKKDKMVRLNVPTESYDVFKATGYLTPTRRVEFYSEDMFDAGEAMAKWVPPLIHTTKRKQYPLHLFVARHRVFMQTQFSEIPELKVIAGKEPWMRLNPSDAVQRDIRDGDMVDVFNDRGKLIVKVRLSQSVPPGIAQMWFGYRASEYVEGAPTLLQIPCGSAETFDDAASGWLKLVKKRWGPPPGELPSWQRWPYTINGEWRIAGNWDVVFDNYCEVRKSSERK